MLLTAASSVERVSLCCDFTHRNPGSKETVRTQQRASEDRVGVGGRERDGRRCEETAAVGRRAVEVKASERREEKLGT